MFAEKLGTIKSFSARLSLNEGEEPKIFKPRSVPYAVRGAIEEELDRLEQQGILKKVTYSEWATPIVAVAKPDGRYRICGDFKVKATPEKITAVEKTPLPQIVQQLRSFLGLLNYYQKFLPNLATVVKPLNELLQKEKKWSWSSKCTQAVRTAKQLLTTSNVLTHYDPTLPLKLAADASQYGLGALISHLLPGGGDERPIAFALRSLSKSEQNYAQIDKEALALIFGVQKFHAYIFGRKFTLVTDH